MNDFMNVARNEKLQNFDSFSNLMQKNNFAEELSTFIGNNNAWNELKNSEKAVLEERDLVSRRVSILQRRKEEVQEQITEAEKENNVLATKVSLLEQQIHNNDMKINDLRNSQVQTAKKGIVNQRDQAVCDLLENVSQIQWEKTPSVEEPLLLGTIVKDSNIDMFSFNLNETSEKDVIPQLWGKLTKESSSILQTDT